MAQERAKRAKARRKSAIERQELEAAARSLLLMLMKLRLNIPFEDLDYRFTASIAPVFRVFSAWIVLMDAKLFPLVYWPEREQLWHTLPMCFQYAFGKKKVTEIIDCFKVFMERKAYLLARAQTSSSYERHNTIKILIGITLQCRMNDRIASA